MMTSLATLLMVLVMINKAHSEVTDPVTWSTPHGTQTTPGIPCDGDRPCGEGECCWKNRKAFINDEIHVGTCLASDEDSKRCAKRFCDKDSQCSDGWTCHGAQMTTWGQCQPVEACVGKDWYLNRANGHCYRLYKGFENYVNWLEAKTKCENDGAQLISTKTQEEYNYILNNSGGDGVWIDLTDFQTEGEWLWNKKEPVTWTRWRKAKNDDAEQPDNTSYWTEQKQDQNGADCAKINWDGWMDDHCVWEHNHFICVRPSEVQPSRPASVTATSTRVSKSGTTTLTCNHGNQAPVKYRWRKDGQDIEGIDVDPSLPLWDFDESMAGEYACAVTLYEVVISPWSDPLMVEYEDEDEDESESESEDEDDDVTAFEDVWAEEE